MKEEKNVATRNVLEVSKKPSINHVTAGIGRMVHPPKNDLFSISDFVTFTIITGKMYVILDDYDGNVVLKKHMHAAIHWIIRHIITFSERVSRINEGFFISARLVHPSQPGSAWSADFKGRQTRVAIANWPRKATSQWLKKQMGCK